jgi:DNA-binding CsgD family transcriptional regulator
VGCVSSVDTRVAQWVDIATEMLSAPLTAFPVGVIGRGLIDSFEADYAAVNWRRPDGTSGLEAVTRLGAGFGGHAESEAAALATAAATSPLLDHHPLVRWYLATGSGAPQSMHRVPVALRSDRSAEAVDFLHRIGSDQEVSIPLHLHGLSHLAIVVGRSGRGDYSNEDMAVARRVQPLLVAVHRQLGSIGPAVPEHRLRDLGLSGRELAVLQLLATGRTAGAIGWALGCSPRTVQKHVEHLYRKLGVKDRVNAVRIGREAGLIAPPVSAVSPGFPEPDPARVLLPG